LATNPYVDQYRKSAVAGASPLQLVVMLYDGCLRFMEAGKRAIQDRDLEKQNDSLQRAQRIIAELMSTLDMEKGGDVSQNLLSLYTFAYNRLVEGNIEDRVEYVDHAIQVMSGLRDSWVQLESASRTGAPYESAA
jgi:flagellar protein FliS